jgi:hypothetical protein
LLDDHWSGSRPEPRLKLTHQGNLRHISDRRPFWVRLDSDAHAHRRRHPAKRQGVRDPIGAGSFDSKR